ncbi:MAG TPA: hypothetical protein VF427_08590 [Noviherbaspirillum sp.]
MRVTNVNLSIDGDNLRVSAVVITPTLGWSNLSLNPVEYVVFPPDGVIDIDVVATPPAGNAATSVMMFPLELVVDNRAAIKGVRLRYQGEALISVLNLLKNAQDIGTDPIFIEAGSFDGDQLFLNVRYAGGCGIHSFQLSWDGQFMKSMPPQISAKLSHAANGDQCKSLQKELLRFDVSPALGEHHSEISYVHVYSGQNQISIPYKKI